MLHLLHSTVTGSQSIIFNKRFASMKSALILSSGGTNCVNKSFDFIDITNKGTYQIQIGSICFPQLQLNVKYTNASILQELRKSQGSLYDPKNSMSINTVEFSRNDFDIHTTPTTLVEPGKFIVGIDCISLGILYAYILSNGHNLGG